jgi:hypothetical protein
MTSDKKPPGARPPFLHVVHDAVGGRNDQRVPGSPDSGVEDGAGLDQSKGGSGGQAVDQAALELRMALMELAQSRTYTGYHLILHTYNPVTDDETWEAVTQGMTLKDLVFAAANMNARIQDLMSSAQESPGPDPLPGAS